MYTVLIVGGGAAGFYAALHMARENPNLKVAILEQQTKVLSKVKISGGGRCNVTNAEDDPAKLVTHYPRGSKELLGPFFKHGSRDTQLFFETNGIQLKSEADGRVFPVTDSSHTVIDFFLEQCEIYGIDIIKSARVLRLEEVLDTRQNNGFNWNIHCENKTYQAKYVLIATGGNQKFWHMLQNLGYQIVPPVPSLFSFNIDDPILSGLQGLSTLARVTVIKKKLTSKEITVGLKSSMRSGQVLQAEGPLLVTHWGLSGPAILKLSAWGARELFEYGYRFTIRVNWMPEYYEKGIVDLLKEVKSVEGKKTVYRTHAFEIPRKLWGRLVIAAGISKDLQWAQLSKSGLEKLADSLCATEFHVDGKSTNKEEFVTAGGVDLKHIDFGSFRSKQHSHLYFAGEVLNIDGITGGFNFQSAWTAAYLAAKDIALRSKENGQQGSQTAS